MHSFIQNEVKQIKYIIYSFKVGSYNDFGRMIGMSGLMCIMMDFVYILFIKDKLRLQKGILCLRVFFFRFILFLCLWACGFSSWNLKETSHPLLSHQLIPQVAFFVSQNFSFSINSNNTSFTYANASSLLIHVFIINYHINQTFILKCTCHYYYGTIQNYQSKFHRPLFHPTLYH